MALTKFVLCVFFFTVATQAKYVWQDDNEEDGGWPSFPRIKVPNVFFPPLPQPPPLPIFGQIAAPGFPFFPNIPFPKIPTADEIKNIKPDPGYSYNGIAVSSNNGWVKDKDGNWKKSGGTTVVSNNNGDITEYAVAEPADGKAHTAIII